MESGKNFSKICVGTISHRLMPPDGKAYKANMTDNEERRGWVADTLLVRTSAIIGIAACLCDLGMTRLLGSWYPGYRPLLQAMSDLGEKGSPVAQIASTWWVTMGLMFIVFGYGFHRAFRHRGKPATTAAWMLALYGIGEGLGSGLVPGAPGRAFRTPNSIIHNLLGGVGVVAAILLPFFIMKLCEAQRSRALFRYSRGTSIAGILFLTLFLVSNFYHSTGCCLSYSGLWQRLFMLTYYLYFMYLAFLMLIHRNGDPSILWRSPHNNSR
jgi:hypothetical protein